MKIAIIEPMFRGHSTFVETLISIFSSKQENVISVYINNNNYDQSLDKYSNRDNIKIQWIEDQKIIGFIKNEINFNIYDRIYITTLEKNFKKYLDIFQYPKVYLTIHNIDEWFNFSFTKKFLNYFYSFTLSKSSIYNFKKIFIYSKWKKKILALISSRDGKFVVLNKLLKEHLKQFISESRISVIPFSFYDKQIGDLSRGNTRIRICIPGIVSANRRDYFSFLSFLENYSKDFKDKLEVDLLGSISNSEKGSEIITVTKHLREKGYIIHTYSEKYIPLNDFNKELSKCDIVLGNLKIKQGKFSYYGLTKDTGMTFCMIKAGKPGIIIKDYPVITELKSSVVQFSDYDRNLHEIFSKIVKDSIFLNRLKEEAISNSKKFTPDLIYNSIM